MVPMVNRKVISAALNFLALTYSKNFTEIDRHLTQIERFYEQKSELSEDDCIDSVEASPIVNRPFDTPVVSSIKIESQGLNPDVLMKRIEKQIFQVDSVAEVAALATNVAKRMLRSDSVEFVRAMMGLADRLQSTFAPFKGLASIAQFRLSVLTHISGIFCEEETDEPTTAVMSFNYESGYPNRDKLMLVQESQRLAMYEDMKTLLEPVVKHFGDTMPDCFGDLVQDMLSQPLKPVSTNDCLSDQPKLAAKSFNPSKLANAVVECLDYVLTHLESCSELLGPLSDMLLSLMDFDALLLKKEPLGGQNSEYQLLLSVYLQTSQHVLPEMNMTVDDIPVDVQDVWPLDFSSPFTIQKYRCNLSVDSFECLCGHLKSGKLPEALQKVLSDSLKDNKVLHLFQKAAFHADFGGYRDNHVENFGFELVKGQFNPVLFDHKDTCHLPMCYKPGSVESPGSVPVIHPSGESNSNSLGTYLGTNNAMLYTKLAQQPVCKQTQTWIAQLPETVDMVVEQSSQKGRQLGVSTGCVSTKLKRLKLNVKSELSLVHQILNLHPFGDFLKMTSGFFIGQGYSAHQVWNQHAESLTVLVESLLTRFGKVFTDQKLLEALKAGVQRSNEGLDLRTLNRFLKQLDEMFDRLTNGAISLGRYAKTSLEVFKKDLSGFLNKNLTQNEAQLLAPAPVKSHLTPQFEFSESENSIYESASEGETNYNGDESESFDVGKILEKAKLFILDLGELVARDEELFLSGSETGDTGEDNSETESDN